LWWSGAVGSQLTCGAQPQVERQAYIRRGRVPPVDTTPEVLGRTLRRYEQKQLKRSHKGCRFQQRRRAIIAVPQVGIAGLPQAPGTASGYPLDAIRIWMAWPDGYVLYSAALLYIRLSE
jgi:hypothetical protein